MPVIKMYFGCYLGVSQPLFLIDMQQITKMLQIHIIIILQHSNIPRFILEIYANSNCFYQGQLKIFLSAFQVLTLDLKIFLTVRRQVSNGAKNEFS